MLSGNLQMLVNRRGQPATLRYKSSGTYVPASGVLDGSADTDVSIKAYFADFNLSELTSDSILMGDRVAVIPARDTSGSLISEPDNEDQILTVGDTVVIKKVQKIYNASTLVCYLCQVRE